MAAAIWWKVQDFYSWIKKKTVFFFFLKFRLTKPENLRKREDQTEDVKTLC